MKKILIIEDETVLLEMYVRKLSKAGFKVLSTDDAKMGVELAQKEKPDLVLLDILLPREDGIYFLEKIRENPETSKLPVLAFSNFDDPLAQKEAKKLGILSYLIKADYTPKQMIGKIKEYLRD